MSSEKEEMNRLTQCKNFAASTVTKPAKKKVASYLLKSENEKSEPLLDLESAIKQKKDVKFLKDSYDPIYVEQYWYSWWEKQNYFRADGKIGKDLPADKKFIIVVPPPNVTGYLHIGHGLTAAIEDCLIRWNRMRGLHTLYLPGTDHAGIATQVFNSAKKKNNSG